MANKQIYTERRKKIFKKANQHHHAGRLKEAHAFYLKLLELNPDDSEAYYKLAIVLNDANHPEDAIPYFEKAITLGVRDAEVFAELAQTMIQLSHFHDALPMAKAAVTLNPDNLLALRSITQTLFALGQYENAYAYGDQLISKSNSNAADRILLAEIYADSNQANVAIALVNEALSLDPCVKKAEQTLCSAYIGVHRTDEAMQIIERNLDKTPNNLNFKCMKAYVLEREGKYDKAFALIKPLITDYTHINRNVIVLYASLAKRFDEQEQALHLLEKLLEKKNIPVSIQHIALHYLGAIYDDLGLYDKAFKAFEKCNVIKPHHYNDQEFDTHICHIRDSFTKHYLEQSPIATHNSARPIFIVGMPRSGTSLTETILARHPEVYAGGELSHIKHIANLKLPDILKTKDVFPDYLQVLSTDSLNEAADYYLEKIDQLALNNESHVTDKMPMNFTYLGLIALLFPKAHIIHCTRNPLATGISCYMTNFYNVGEMAFSQDLKNIGLYYKRYEQLMEHWHQVLPTPIYDLSYDSLVSNPETEIRNLLKFCDLPWHEGCLTPHKSKESAKTASYNQVRQPINTRSIEKWKNYEQYLQPLKDVLELT